MPSLDTFPALALSSESSRFLVLCLRSRWAPECVAEAHALMQAGVVDWQGLWQLVEMEALAPLLYDCVRGRQLVPPALEETLAQAYRESALRNAYQSLALEDVLQRLEEAAIPALVLKGAALGEPLYGNPALRPMVDIDLLLRPGQVEAACQTLAQADYRRMDPEPHPGLTLAFENELLLRKEDHPEITLELHWHLLNSSFYQGRVPLDWFWQTSRTVSLGGTQAQVLGLEASLLYLSAHLVLHHRGQGLRWLYDIAALVAVDPSRVDWDTLIARAVDFDLVTPLQWLLPRLADPWQLPIPEERLSQVAALPVSPAERRVLSLLLAEERPAGQRLWTDLMGLRGWRRRAYFALANLFPTAAYMRERYALPSDLLLPFAYPYRWALGLWDLAASHLASPREAGRGQ